MFDYEVGPDGKALVHATVEAVLDYSLCTMSSPAVILESVKQTAVTDSNGYWQMNLVPNANISPANTVYTIATPFRRFQVTVPTSSPAQASANLVNVPVLPGITTTLSGGLTVAGNLTFQGSYSILTTAGNLTLNPASALTLIPSSVIFGPFLAVTLSPGDIVVNRGGASPGTGAIFFGSSANLHNIFYDGTKFLLTDGAAFGPPTSGSGGTGTVYSGTGAPSNSNGSNGDFYFRYDTPGSANQRLYVKAAGAWSGIL